MSAKKRRATAKSAGTKAKPAVPPESRVEPSAPRTATPALTESLMSLLKRPLS
jgi:hypothetical protein